LSVIVSVGYPAVRSAFLYGSKTRGSEDDSLESKHVALISHYMFNITTVVFVWNSSPFIVQTLRVATPQVLTYSARLPDCQRPIPCGQYEHFCY